MVIPLRTVHYEGMPMRYKFGKFKQAPVIRIGTTLNWNTEHDTITPHCRHFAVTKEGSLFEDYHCHLKMDNSYDFELNNVKPHYQHTYLKMVFHTR